MGVLERLSGWVVMSPENTVRKQRGRPFRAGQSGNPAGRPRGARNRSTVAAELLLEGEAKALTRKAIELGLAGDTAALRLCMERLMPPRKDRSISFELPKIERAEDVARASAFVLTAVSEGRITPSEACEVMKLIEVHRRTIVPQTAAQTSFQVTFVPSPAAE